MMEKVNFLKKRWKIASAGIIMQIILGSVYGWSVFKRPLMSIHGWSGTQVSFSFTLTIFFIGAAVLNFYRTQVIIRRKRNCHIRLWRDSQ